MGDIPNGAVVNWDAFWKIVGAISGAGAAVIGFLFMRLENQRTETMGAITDLAKTATDAINGVVARADEERRRGEEDRRRLYDKLEALGGVQADDRMDTLKQYATKEEVKEMFAAQTAALTETVSRLIEDRAPSHRRQSPKAAR